MRFHDYLLQECKPALGCTEPACIAFAASSAARLATGPVQSAHLVCDPRMYKNCYAVGIPHSEHRVGIRWALAIGALLPDPSLKLESFRLITLDILQRATQLLDSGSVTVDVDAAQPRLYVDCRIQRGDVSTRAVIQGAHTRLVKLERGGVAVSIDSDEQNADESFAIREALSHMSFGQLVDMAHSLTDEDRDQLRAGARLNDAIAQHGMGMFPERFHARMGGDAVSRASRCVCAGVYARMCGEDLPVMSVAGSGNKGIVCSLPLAVWGREIKAPQERIDESMALASLVTSLTTHHLGTLSAVCGCSNAAGLGLCAGIVLLDGGGSEQMSLAINNMVGNITGMVCDGAKIGCALKAMTAVDAAFRSAALAMSDVGIPVSDGIVGKDGAASLLNLGRIATQGMISLDAEILDIMREKMRGE
jgi:L-cysteine desulfidase